MVNNAQMKKSQNPKVSLRKRGRRRRRRRGRGQGRRPQNLETKCSRNSSDLPTEILIKVFLYLEFSDILAARSCCKRWFHITNRPEFSSKRIYKIRAGKLSSKDRATKVISACKIDNLYLEDIEMGDVDELFGQIGANIKTLTWKSVRISHDYRLAFNHFTNLQSLKACFVWGTTGVEYLPFGNLPRLKELELTGNDLSVQKYLLDCALESDLLEKLTLGFTKEMEVVVLKILDKQAKILKFLDLYLHGLSGLDVSQWIRIAGKLISLKELSLGVNFSRDVMDEIVKNQKSLRSLSFEGIDAVDDEYLTLVVQELPQLEKLNLIDCHQVMNIGFKKLVKLSKLTVLDLEGCMGITSDNIRSIIGQEANIRLQELYLATALDLDMDVVSFCAKNLPRLRVLCLDNCANLIDIPVMGCSSIQSLEFLERLSLRDCEKLSDQTLCAIRTPHLKFLEIRNCLRMTGCGILILLKHCPAIEEIAFTCSGDISKEDVEVLIKGFSRLRTLTIHYCEDILRLMQKNWKETHCDNTNYEVTLRRST